MKEISIKTKIMLWFTCALVLLVLGTGMINFSVSRQVLDQSVRERLVNIVSSNAEEIEYHDSYHADSNTRDLLFSYKNGAIAIDDNFCDYYEGICTSLVDSQNNLLYGESPIRLSSDAIFSFSTVGTVIHNGDKYYVYEKKLEDPGLEDLWLRGIVSEKESTSILYKTFRASVWILPLLAAVTLLGGFIITRRSFLPVEKINDAANEIAEGSDLTKRIDIGPGEDEIHNLAHTFNAMFDRLEKSFDAEKQFTSDASHELRTPLAVVKANCEYALEFAGNEQEYREALEVIARQADSMSSLLNQLLFFARYQQQDFSISKTDMNLSRLLENLCEDRRILTEGTRLINTDIEPDIHMMGDESLMTGLINNLIDNAIKYSDVNEPVEAALFRDGTAIKLSVRDHGIGIAPENMDKIWDRFYQVDPSRSSSEKGSFGLGLAMVKEIARLHGGYMEVSCPSDGGSCFTLVLP